MTKFGHENTHVFDGSVLKGQNIGSQTQPKMRIYQFLFSKILKDFQEERGLFLEP